MREKQIVQISHLEIFFKACADQTRLRILNLLATQGEVCVGQLVEVLGTNQPKISRHLAYLKRAGLIQVRRDGLWMYYRISESLVDHAAQILSSLLNCCREIKSLQKDVTLIEKFSDRRLQPVKLPQGNKKRDLKRAEESERNSMINIELL